MALRSLQVSANVFPFRHAGMALEEGRTITTEMRSTVLEVFYIRALLHHWQIYYF